MKKYFSFLSLIVSIMLLSGCSSREVPAEIILKVNNTLYYGTDETGPMGDSGCVEGQILSTVEEGAIPTENGSSNFGCVGNSYTFDSGDGFIMVFMDDEAWHCFYSEKTE